MISLTLERFLLSSKFLVHTSYLKYEEKFVPLLFPSLIVRLPNWTFSPCVFKSTRQNGPVVELSLSSLAL